MATIITRADKGDRCHLWIGAAGETARDVVARNAETAANWPRPRLAYGWVWVADGARVTLARKTTHGLFAELTPVADVTRDTADAVAREHGALADGGSE